MRGVLDGEGDVATDPRDQSFEVVSGSSHLSIWETPEQVLPLLRAFIAEVDSRDVEARNDTNRGGSSPMAARDGEKPSL